ncbi:hypothetical protein [Geomonas propionica]|uniref:Uncharacterized protein n=1 Tax=Geomonas propionica TaxID=2798582 RepID=A0ABS0YRF0_9BACT|nr:hypothetical protein [Geomonas propionica]MBJ6800524.1 hypothetical protein [Geomonas propionica]
MTPQAERVLRDYRTAGATKFHGINQSVRNALADKTRFPDSFWTTHQTVLEAYLAASERHDALYHESMLGSKVVIAERVTSQAKLVVLMDEVASFLELAALRTPEILIVSGFRLAKERRAHTRSKATATTQTVQEEVKNSIPA